MSPLYTAASSGADAVDKIQQTVPTKKGKEKPRSRTLRKGGKSGEA